MDRFYNALQSFKSKTKNFDKNSRLVNDLYKNEQNECISSSIYSNSSLFDHSKNHKISKKIQIDLNERESQIQNSYCVQPNNFNKKLKVSNDYDKISCSKYYQQQKEIEEQQKYLNLSKKSQFFSQADKEKRSKAPKLKFFSVFLKKHFRTSPNNNSNENFEYNKNNFYNCPNFDCNSLPHINGASTLVEKTSNNLCLSRIQSFSTLKMRKNNLSNPEYSGSNFEPLIPFKNKFNCNADVYPISPISDSNNFLPTNNFYNKLTSVEKLNDSCLYAKQISQSSSQSSQLYNNEANYKEANTSGTKALKIETPCLKGLLNHGNTCYMNAILQCLACIDSFAEFFVCQKFRNSSNVSSITEHNSDSVTSLLALIMQNLWLNINADVACLQLTKLIANALHFQLSAQQDAQESLIWILDKIHEEIKDCHSIYNNSSIKLYKSEEQLASDALKRVSGSDRSAIINLFRAQFRSSIKCNSCSFLNLTFDPYMTVSLSVAQLQSEKICNVLFVPLENFNSHVICYKLNVKNVTKNSSKHSKQLFTISDIMHHICGTSKGLIACEFKENGLCLTVSKSVVVNSIEQADKQFVIFETSVENFEKNSLSAQNEYLELIITHINGYFPNGTRIGNPYIVTVDRRLSYYELVKEVILKCNFLDNFDNFSCTTDFNLLFQQSFDSAIFLEKTDPMPLYNEWAGPNKSVIIPIIMEWNPAACIKYLNQTLDVVKINDSLLTDNENNSVTLTNLLQDYIKTEIILDWKCPKCHKCSGKKELKFFSMPSVLIFHLKRFELQNDGNTKKINTCVKIPVKGLDMMPYICNSDSKFSTLQSNIRKNLNSNQNQKDVYEPYPLYDLVGIVHHHGERANSGHYTATTQNPIDNCWRNFDDMNVKFIPDFDKFHCSNDAYLLFYERTSTKNNKHGFSSSRWFPNALSQTISLNQKKQNVSLNNSFSNNFENLKLNNEKDTNNVFKNTNSTFYLDSVQFNDLNNKNNFHQTLTPSYKSSKPILHDIASTPKKTNYNFQNKNNLLQNSKISKNAFSKNFLYEKPITEQTYQFSNYLNPKNPNMHQSPNFFKETENYNYKNTTYSPTNSYSTDFFVQPSSSKRSKSYQTLAKTPLTVDPYKNSVLNKNINKHTTTHY